MVSRTTTFRRHALSVRLRGKRFATLLTASHMLDDYCGDTCPASEELLLMESDVCSTCTALHEVMQGQRLEIPLL
ncbi:hypothetical protein HBI56_213750 [Parastagonospora nodorum]|nr:hypothetical protein HBH49_235830 [Parastagonospora nodorum]KAH4181960.1 hypothetical protein HBH42_229910 [Parastagonospora nodorum]KAH4258362.1 hypothetical protein HBI04_218850 [Parastagonospora nodorum]KAH4266321.1 hypothetical protein HBI03_071220 [Parastagonospora nodorum]KAH4894448.1 hypothetical protein HBH74_197290 [Parastagonospora nodorum]